MPSLSLTDLVDYVGKSGTTKLTKAREILERGDYGPEKDHYRKVRSGIQNYHKNGLTEKKELDSILLALTDPKKEKSHRACVTGYKKWLGRKKYTYFEPPFEHWVRSDLNLRVNPEIGLKIDNIDYVVKLYFKSDKLEKKNAAIILAVMGDALGKPAQGTKYAVLDIRRKKLFDTEVVDTSLMPLVEGEAASLSMVWSKLNSSI